MADLASVPHALSEHVDWRGGLVPARPILGLAIFRVKSAKASGEVAASLGLPAATAATPEALGIGPGDWLLFCPEADAPTLKARISAVPGCYAAEQGDALTFLDLGDAVDLIVRLTGLRADALAPGRTARTRIAGIAAIFHGTDDGVRMLFDRSYQRHVRDWLDAAV